PATAILVDNLPASAPGFRIRRNRAWLFFTTGVEGALRQMVLEQFTPFVKKTYNTDAAVREHKFLTLDHGESSLAEMLGRVQVPEGITLGFRPSPPHVEIKVIARGATVIAALDQFLPLVRNVLGTAIVSERYSSIAEEVHHAMLGSGKT